MLVNIIQNTISSFRSALAAAEVITTNLKMWLGFETSETLGREEVVNGDFATDSDWSEGTGWDIDVVNNKATCDGTQTVRSSLFQTGVLQQGIQYQFEFTLKDVTSGNVRLRNGIGASEIYISDKSLNDTYIVVTEVIASNQSLVVDADENFEGSISNVSVKELTQITPDKSGNNNVGELFTGKALDFDGSNDNVAFTFTTPVKSAVFWVKPLDTGLENIMWFGGAFAGTKSIRSNGNVIQTAGLSSVSVYVDGVQTTSVPLNQWSRVVVNFASVTPSELKFGYAFNSYGYIQLSDVQLYNENLSTDDIAYDYANPQNLVTDRSGTSIALSNLKGYWHLSEGDGFVAYDSSGEGNNGTINGATYEPAQPRIPQLGMMNWAKSTPVSDEVTLIPNPNNTSQDILGNAVRDRLNSFNLDGSGYSSVANNSSIKPTSALSIECWIKTPDVSSASKYISDADVGATRFFLMQVSSKARFKIATTEIDSAANLTDNTWHYIAGTWNGSTMTLYVDEETPVTISKSGAITYDTDDLFIGSRLGTGEYFDGLISDVRLYDRALTSDEVENNYNAGLSAHTN